MRIRIADKGDVEYLARRDKHISERELDISVSLSSVYIAEEDSRFIGWLRYNLF